MLVCCRCQVDLTKQPRTYFYPDDILVEKGESGPYCNTCMAELDRKLSFFSQGESYERTDDSHLHHR